MGSVVPGKSKSPLNFKEILEKRDTQLASFSRLSAIISQSSLEEALTGTLDQLLVMTEADIGSIHAVDAKVGDLKLIASSGLIQGFTNAESRIPMGECLCGEAARTGKVIFTQDLSAEDPRFVCRSACRDQTFGSVVCIPLKSRERVLGILTIYAKSTNHFSPMEHELVVTIGRQIAMAIENAQLYEQTRELAVLEERKLIAQEIHDGIAQSLAYLNLETQRLETFLKNHPSEQALSVLSNIRQEVQNTYEDTRELLVGFRAKFREGEPLSEVLSHYLQNYRHRTGIQVDLMQPHSEPTLTPTTQVQVFRIIQEALANIRKHASAEKVTVSLGNTPDALEIHIQDNGQGFDPLAVPNRPHLPMGLEIMKERVAQLRGRMQLTSQPGSGTGLLIQIPLEPAHGA